MSKNQTIAVGIVLGVIGILSILDLCNLLNGCDLLNQVKFQISSYIKEFAWNFNFKP